MRNRFDRQLDMLNEEMTEMGNLIEQAIENAVKAVVSQDIQTAKETITFDDEVDHQEKKIESLCMRLLLQQQPVARDLRLISSALKMITDMERIGDQAADIAEITIAIGDRPYIKKIEHIKQMAKETTNMVVDSIEAFVNKDEKLAREIIERDDVVDELFSNVRTELVKLILENPENGEQATDLLMIAKYFERIGDHATNIAEWVIYSITGFHPGREEK